MSMPIGLPAGFKLKELKKRIGLDNEWVLVDGKARLCVCKQSIEYYILEKIEE